MPFRKKFGTIGRNGFEGKGRLERGEEGIDRLGPIFRVYGQDRKGP